MRIDHLAFRVKNKDETANFFIKALGYKVAKKYPNGFHIDFDDGTYADCLVLEPQNKNYTNLVPWVQFLDDVEYHIPPEIFISEGSDGSIVDTWVKKHGNGLHHVALLVDSVEEKMKEWKENGFAEFADDEPTKCPGLTQIFTKPSELTGFIWELIEREPDEDGFCTKNVKKLMESTNI